MVLRSQQAPGNQGLRLRKISLAPRFARVLEIGNRFKNHGASVRNSFQMNPVESIVVTSLGAKSINIDCDIIILRASEPIALEQLSASGAFVLATRRCRN